MSLQFFWDHWTKAAGLYIALLIAIPPLLGWTFVVPIRGAKGLFRWAVRGSTRQRITTPGSPPEIAEIVPHEASAAADEQA